MDKLIYLLPVLGCVAMTGVMMLMMRGGHAGQAGHGPAAAQPDPTTREEIAMLRAEIATLRAAQAPAPAPTGEADRMRQRGGPA